MLMLYAALYPLFPRSVITGFIPVIQRKRKEIRNGDGWEPSTSGKDIAYHKGRSVESGGACLASQAAEMVWTPVKC